MEKTISAIELMSMDLAPARFFIEGLLPEGLCILASPPKYGKSWFVLDLCLSVAAGLPFLNRPVTPAATLYLALEDSLSRLKDRIAKIWHDQPIPHDFYLRTQAPNLENGLLDEIEQHLDFEPRTKIVVIDTLQKIRGTPQKGETSYAYDYRELGILQSFATKHKLCIIMVHHVRKMKDDTDVFAAISGTHGLTGAADTSMVMQKSNRNNKETTLCITGRDVEETELAIKIVNNKWQHEGKYTDQFFDMLKSLMPFEGTMTELMAKAGLDIANNGTAIAFGMKFNQLLPFFEENGIAYESKRTEHKRCIYLKNSADNLTT